MSEKSRTWSGGGDSTLTSAPRSKYSNPTEPLGLASEPSPTRNRSLRSRSASSIHTRQRVETEEHGAVDEERAHLAAAQQPDGRRVDQVLTGALREMEAPVERDLGVRPRGLGRGRTSELGAAGLRQLVRR